jgi:hypothetical protein
VKGLTVRDVEAANASAAPLPGMHGPWLEHVQGAQVAGFRCSPVQEGSNPQS